MATVVGVGNLAIAISRVTAGSWSYPIGPFMVALAMGLVILGQIWQLREQGKPPSN
jgi:hypothetical protein